MSSVQDMLARLWNKESNLSRNRKFELFEKPAARRALRLHLRLRKLEQELTAYNRSGGVEIRLETTPLDENGPILLCIEHPALRLKRRVYLSRQELALLCQSPRIAALLLHQQRAEP